MVKKPLVFCILVSSAVSVLGCECVPKSVKQAKESSEIVFRGTITQMSAGKIVFRVTQIWKGDVGPTFDMPDVTEAAACLGFREKLLANGNDLLVFASRLHRYAGDNDYFTNVCLPTGLASETSETLRHLGKARPALGKRIAP
jgi:hypothetical protein